MGEVTPDDASSGRGPDRTWRGRTARASLLAAGIVMAVAVVWVLGPGAKWWLVHVDGVPVGGKGGLSGMDLTDALDRVRGRAMAVGTGLLAVVAIYYTASNAASARRSAQAAIDNVEAARRSAEMTEAAQRRTFELTEEGQRRTYELTERGQRDGRFTAAAEQLGSDKAPVRFAGLYALERLGQDNPEHRQTVINVICAYLRMPYDPPDPVQEDEEFQVRRGAQNIIADHLRLSDVDLRTERQQRPTPADPRFWPDIDLDLSGATIIDFDFTAGRAETADFSGARFLGPTFFTHSEFNIGIFHGAKFETDARFFAAWFETIAHFGGTIFNFPADFTEAAFCSRTFFSDAEFKERVVFHDTRARAGFPGPGDPPRSWPPGWTERPIDAGEQPRNFSTRWRQAIQRPSNTTWNLVVPKNDSDTAFGIAQFPLRRHGRRRYRAVLR